VRGINFLPLLPLEVDDDDVDPSLSMPEHMASLSFPPKIMPFSPSGENLLDYVVVLPRFTVVGPLRASRGSVVALTCRISGA